jgi:hypothetical protein
VAQVIGAYQAQNMNSNSSTTKKKKKRQKDLRCDLYICWL